MRSALAVDGGRRGSVGPVVAVARVVGAATVGVASAALWVSTVRSDTVGRLACPLTGETDCSDRSCPLGKCERTARRWWAAVVDSSS